MIAALILQASITGPLPDDVWADMTYGPSLAYSSETIAFLRDETSSMADPRILRMTLRQHGKPTVTIWADSRTCPGAAEAVRHLRSIPMPTPSLPSDATDLILDGVGYRVRFRAHYGSEIGFPLELNSNVGTPLAEWVNRTRAMLKPCWTTARPAKDP
ncbi:hypothetical protein ACQR50_00320 [Sphingomonas sp. Xoc002]|uniref:hypothetical protein n=1 Tax=Sphingomonas sp. Xoc002 TaxID=2837624 RepID=UPI003D180E99